MIGTTLSHFQILTHIGGGGMGDVYEAVDLNLDRRVAIKVLPQDATRDPLRIARFIQEAKAASALSHPGIVTVFEIGQQDGQHFIAMERVEGETLRGRLERGGDPRALIPIFIQIANALEKAHSAGIVHRDLKPENVMVTPDGYVKILDFGLAKLVQADLSDPDAKTTAQQLTREGTVVGTMGYMSPEQLRGERVDQRTDIFALGCILYEAFGGRQPFRAPTQVDTIHNVLHETPAPLRDAPMQRITAKALAKNVGDRYTSARELATDLRATTTTTARAPSRISRALAIGLGLAVLTVLSAVLLIRRPATPPTTFEKMQIEPLPGTGGAIHSAISPDGKYIAYTRPGPGGTALLIRQIDTGAETTLVPPQPDLEYPQFSPDTGTVFYKNDNTVIEVPLFGGSRQTFLSQVGYGGMSFSPDQKRIAFARRGSIYVENADGSDLHRIAGVTMKASYGNVAWSPDPNVVAAVLRSLQGVIGSRVQRIRLDVADPVAVAAASPDFFDGRFQLINGVAWLPDGSGVVVSTMSSYVAPQQLFVLSTAAPPRRITNDLFAYETMTMTTDASTIAATQVDRRWAIVEVPIHGATATRQIAEGTGNFAFESSNRDGAIVYDAPAESGVDVWIVGRDGGRRRLFTTHNPVLPQLSPDGRTIAYIGEAGDRTNVWLVDRDGNNRRQLTTGNLVRNPRWSPDGRFIYCTSRDSGRAMLWKVPVNGGKPQVFDTPYCVRPVPSPDGKTIAAVTNYEWQLGFVDAATGRTIKETKLRNIDSHFHWTPDGRRVAIIIGSNVVAFDMNSGAVEKLTNFQPADVSSFDWAPDQRSIICTRTTESRRVVLIRRFR